MISDVEGERSPATGSIRGAVCGFALADVVRRAQGAVLDLAGLGPRECSYRIVSAGPGWRLRSYSGSENRPAMLIVSAPIKRPYIWDLAPAMSAVRLCARQGFHIFLLEWIPPEDAERGRGLVEFVDDVGRAVACVAAEVNARPFLVGHSLGGTLAAIWAALEPEAIQGLVLLGSPLCFRRGVSRFGDSLVALAPVGLSESELIPGSLLSQLSALASPEEFVWARSVDAALSLADARAAELHTRIERWALDEVSLSGKLVAEILQWLYREDRFCRGVLTIRGRSIGPSCLRTPTFAVANTADQVVPPASVTNFLDAMPPGYAQLLLYSGDIGACLQHLAVLVGRNAHGLVWPAIISWVNEHQDARRGKARRR
jgi:polyhydroxyalkanoate synthase subunit PhaC